MTSFAVGKKVPLLGGGMDFANPDFQRGSHVPLEIPVEFQLQRLWPARPMWLLSVGPAMSCDAAGAPGMAPAKASSATHFTAKGVWVMNEITTAALMSAQKRAYSGEYRESGYPLHSERRLTFVPPDVIDQIVGDSCVSDECAPCDGELVHIDDARTEAVKYSVIVGAVLHRAIHYDRLNRNTGSDYAVAFARKSLRLPARQLGKVFDGTWQSLERNSSEAWDYLTTNGLIHNFVRIAEKKMNGDCSRLGVTPSDQLDAFCSVADAFRTIRFNLLDWASKMGKVCPRPVSTFCAAMDKAVNAVPERLACRKWRIAWANHAHLDEAWSTVLRDVPDAQRESTAQFLLTFVAS